MFWKNYQTKPSVRFAINHIYLLIYSPCSVKSEVECLCSQIINFGFLTCFAVKKDIMDRYKSTPSKIRRLYFNLIKKSTFFFFEKWNLLKIELGRNLHFYIFFFILKWDSSEPTCLYSCLLVIILFLKITESTHFLNFLTSIYILFI